MKKSELRKIIKEEVQRLSKFKLNEAHYTVVANLGGGKKRKENLDNDDELGKFMYDMENKNAISVDVTKFKMGKKQTIFYEWDGKKWVIKKKGSIQKNR